MSSVEGILITFPTDCDMTCHVNGECYLTEDGDVGCRCKSGYEGNGMTYCNGRFKDYTMFVYL